MASQLDCVCQIAAHEGHGSAFCHTIGTSTDGDGRRLVGRVCEGILRDRKAPSLPSAALPESTEVE